MLSAEQIAEIRNAALDEAARELAMVLMLNAEEWSHDYFAGYDDARNAILARKEPT